MEKETQEMEFTIKFTLVELTQLANCLSQASYYLSGEVERLEKEGNEGRKQIVEDELNKSNAFILNINHTIHVGLTK